MVIDIIATGVVFKVFCRVEFALCLSCVANCAILLVLEEPFVFDQKVLLCAPAIVSLKNVEVFFVLIVVATTNLRTILPSIDLIVLNCVRFVPFEV